MSSTYCMDTIDCNISDEILQGHNLITEMRIVERVACGFSVLGRHLLRRSCGNGRQAPRSVRSKIAECGGSDLCKNLRVDAVYLQA